MTQFFGKTSSGDSASLYTISRGSLTAKITDFGAALVQLYVPDRNGELADVVLGYDDVKGYAESTTYFGATVGRNANRTKNAAFPLGDKTVQLTPNENGNNLHSGPNGYSYRLWQVKSHTNNSITFYLQSLDGDQGFPGNAEIQVTYTLEYPSILRICYDAVCDKDTVFNLTNHSYFNLAGHDKTDRAMKQLLTLPGRFFNPDDAQNIPTGELRPVDGTPMDFRIPKPIGQDVEQDYECLLLQGGYDHNFEVFCQPCAILSDPISGRTMSIITDRPGIQVYSGNYLNDHGKDGVFYSARTGVALEPQFYPDSVNHPQWPQPIVPANTPYHSETIYQFKEDSSNERP